MSLYSARTARMAQYLIAAPFLILGSWCLLDPGTVESLSLAPDHYIGSDASRILVACFGAQAILSGLFALCSRFTRVTFLVYAIALLPFFWFNYYFTMVVPVFSRYMLIDFASNTIMLLLCVIGWLALSPENRSGSP